MRSYFCSAEQNLSQNDTTQRLIRDKFGSQRFFVETQRATPFFLSERRSGCNELISKMDPSILRQYDLRVLSFASILRRYDKKGFLTRPDSPSMQCKCQCIHQRHFLGYGSITTLGLFIKRNGHLLKEGFQQGQHQYR